MNYTAFFRKRILKKQNYASFHKSKAERDYNQLHEKVMDSVYEIKEEQDYFVVKKVNENNEKIYKIDLNPFSICNPLYCKIKCSNETCNSHFHCAHKYRCSCPSYCERNICKHLHLIKSVEPDNLHQMQEETENQNISHDEVQNDMDEYNSTHESSVAENNQECNTTENSQTILKIKDNCIAMVSNIMTYLNGIQAEVCNRQNMLDIENYLTKAKSLLTQQTKSFPTECTKRKFVKQPTSLFPRKKKRRLRRFEINETLPLIDLIKQCMKLPIDEFEWYELLSINPFSIANEVHSDNFLNKEQMDFFKKYNKAKITWRCENCDDYSLKAAEQDFIQCDFCLKWFHVTCCNIPNINNLDELEFKCHKCSTDGNEIKDTDSTFNKSYHSDEISLNNNVEFGVMDDAYEHQTNFARMNEIQESQTLGVNGLENKGNNCYANSILQCLFNLRSFNELVLNNDFVTCINKFSKTKGEITVGIKELFKKLHLNTSGCVNPEEFMYTVFKHLTFKENVQEDGAEFYCQLINTMSEETMSQDNDAPKDIIVSNDESFEEAIIRTMKSMKDSKISDLFYGIYRLQNICNACNISTPSYDWFTSMRLSFNSNKNFYSLGDLSRTVINITLSNLQ